MKHIKLHTCPRGAKLNSIGAIVTVVMIFIFTPHTNAQSVGINNPNPIWPLDIIGPHGVIKLLTTTSTYGSVLELRNNNGSAEYLGAINFNDPGNSYPGQIGYLSNQNLTFRTNYYERMRIDENGNVGIGTTDPQYPLDISSYQSVARLSSTFINGSILELRNNASGTDFYLGSINFNDDQSTRGQILYLHDGITGSNDKIILKLASFETIKLQNNHLQLNGNASKWTSGEWWANSDARLKKNIKGLDSQTMLNKLLALEGVSYEWNDDKTGITRPEGIQYGFIAQKIQEVFPTLVEEDNQGFLQTAYGTYDPMMVEAIRALDEKIKLLQKENDELKAQLNNIISGLNDKGNVKE